MELGHSLSVFMRKAGLILASAGGGKRSDAKRLREQMEKAVRESYQLQQTVTEANREGQRWLNMDVAPDGELWWT